MSDATPPGAPWMRRVDLPRQAIRSVLAELAEDDSWSAYESVWTERLRARLSSLFRVTHVRLPSSGTIAVELALRGVGVRERDEVLLAAYDFPGNFRAVEAIGARPVLVDVVENGWVLASDAIEAAYSPKLRAVVVSHLHGQLAPIAEIRRWCDDHDIALVEDACQVPGAQIAGRPAGSWGDAAALSFGGSKLLTAGRGGAVLTARDDVAQRITVFAERGNDAFPMSSLQAAVVLPQLEQLEEMTERREAGAQIVRDHLASVPCVAIPATPEPAQSAYYKLGMLLASDLGDTARTQLLEEARQADLPLGAGFRGFAGRSTRRCRKVGDLANARRAARETILLHHTVLSHEPSIVAQAAARLKELVAKIKR